MLSACSVQFSNPRPGFSGCIQSSNDIRISIVNSPANQIKRIIYENNRCTENEARGFDRDKLTKKILYFQFKPYSKGYSPIEDQVLLFVVKISPCLCLLKLAPTAKISSKIFVIVKTIFFSYFHWLLYVSYRDHSYYWQPFQMILLGLN